MTIRRKMLATLAVVAVACAPAAFVAFGSFTNAHDPFPGSVLAPSR